MMTKTRYATNLTVSLMTSKPDCNATLLVSGQFRLGDGGTVLVQGEGKGGKKVLRGRYCLDRGRVRVCKEIVENR